MKIIIPETAQKDIDRLPKEQKINLLSILIQLPYAIKNIHQHSGLGLRKIHSSGFYEARIGLALRIIFQIINDEIWIKRIGNHDDVERFIKTL